MLQVGVVDVPNASVARKGRLRPGNLLLIDFEEGRLVEDAEVSGAASKAGRGNRLACVQTALGPPSSISCARCIMLMLLRAR